MPEPSRDHCPGCFFARRMAGDRCDEVVALEGVQREIRVGGDRRSAQYVTKQRNLAERVARPEFRPLLAVDGDRGSPFSMT